MTPDNIVSASTCTCGGSLEEHNLKGCSLLKVTVPPLVSDHPRISMAGKINVWHVCFGEGRIKTLVGCTAQRSVPLSLMQK